ncbi:unnamed protein product [Aspergillus oryzae]|uniref:Unnamed protein product n=1 Tax=Aspergillus oryzae var. brunneus TaxID=332754 RepID=A0ABQ6KW51_ASPOZ|nr:unnamed protein product [Aspergillus oryzae]GMF91433.1 unnamed protein product [Aspergillus oryzae]GMG03130.1 unnamed protein product [Aspergillus oryzae]GMG46332.1 unnamed protein product [Aspergillus oryzae var. brunneus]
MDVNENNYTDSDPDGLTFFGRLQKSPAYFEAFTGHMEAWTAWKTPWTKVYDTTALLEGAKLDDASPLVVDLGGNTGTDISYVLAKHPDIPAGSLVLQDLPEVIANVHVDKKITAMVHDFFLPQPVKGERHSGPEIQVCLLILELQGAVLTFCTPFSMTGQMTKRSNCS